MVETANLDPTVTGADGERTNGETFTENDGWKKCQNSTEPEVDCPDTGLDRTTTELDRTTTDLDRTKTELDRTTTDLNSTKTDLDSTKTDLDSTKTDLDSMKTELETTDAGRRMVSQLDHMETSGQEIM